MEEVALLATKGLQSNEVTNLFKNDKVVDSLVWAIKANQRKSLHDKPLSAKAFWPKIYRQYLDFYRVVPELKLEDNKTIQSVLFFLFANIGYFFTMLSAYYLTVMRLGTQVYFYKWFLGHCQTLSFVGLDVVQFLAL